MHDGALCMSARALHGGLNTSFSSAHQFMDLISPCKDAGHAFGIFVALAKRWQRAVSQA
jgi:hypothetical protein